MMQWHNPIWAFADASLMSHIDEAPAGYGYVIRLGSKKYHIGSGKLDTSKNTVLLELKSILVVLKTLNKILINKRINNRPILVFNDNNLVNRTIMQHPGCKDDVKLIADEVVSYVQTFGCRLHFIFRKSHFNSVKYHSLAHFLAFNAAKHGVNIDWDITSIANQDINRWLWRKINNR